MPKATAGQHSSSPPDVQEVRPDWTLYRPRQHAVWLGILVILFAGWIGFLVWMTR